MSGFAELLKAVVVKLEGHAQLVAAVKSISDAVPESDRPADNANFPYVVVSDFAASPFNTDTKRGIEGILSINIYSRHMGKKESADIADLVYAALDAKELVMPNFEFLECNFNGLVLAGIAAEKTYRAEAQYDVLYRQL